MAATDRLNRHCTCTVITSGPYLQDPLKAVGGYGIVEADDIETAYEIAARIPAARLGGALEIRAVETYW